MSFRDEMRAARHKVATSQTAQQAKDAETSRRIISEHIGYDAEARILESIRKKALTIYAQHGEVRDLDVYHGWRLPIGISSCDVDIVESFIQTALERAFEAFRRDVAGESRVVPLRTDRYSGNPPFCMVSTSRYEPDTNEDGARPYLFGARLRVRFDPPIRLN